MELFDAQEYAAARHRDAMRAFREAERSGLTRRERGIEGARWFGIFGGAARRAEGSVSRSAGLPSEG